MSYCRSRSLGGGSPSLRGGASTHILLEKFNQCDPKMVKEELHPFLDKVKVKDLSGHYLNNGETLVVKLNSTKDIATATKLALAMNLVGAQEIDVKRAYNGVYMRFWWD